MVNEKTGLAGILIITLVIMSIYLVSALGVGSPYSMTNPLGMYPGEKKIVQLSLQNAEVDDGVKLKGILLEGKEISSLNEGPYSVNKGEEVLVDLSIIIPDDVNIGDEYLITYKFVEEAAEGEGMINLGRKVGSD